MTDTMQAIRFHDYGGPEVLKLEQVERPHPHANQVLVRAFSAGVNPFDWVSRSGAYKQFMELTFPVTSGVEGAGIIDAVGPGVTTLERGQAVYGILTNAYAEYALAAATDLAPKPASLTFDQAASVPMGALTAWQAVIDDAAVQSGQRVLVHGGAGGVGAYAVQLAHWTGAHVIATASAENAEFVRSLGAEQVVDYKATKFETVVRDLDVVVDTVGGDVIERSWQVLRPGGFLTTVAGMIPAEAGPAHGVRAMSSRRGSTAKLREISELLESKKVKPVVGRVFPLAEAAQAHELSQTRHGRGRIVLHVAD